MIHKSQSAMEYLMTYGWSILIVAVVLGALAYLGVFNPLYFAPKANPGSCQVFRPNGAGTSYDINLLGVCNDEIPQYVARFNGQNPGSEIYLGTSQYLNPGTGSFTVSGWVYAMGYAYPDTRFPIGGGGMDGSEGWILENGYNSQGINVNFGDGTSQVSGTIACDNGYLPANTLGKWTNIVVVFNRTSGEAYAFINGAKQSGSVNIAAVTNSVTNPYGTYLGDSWGWRLYGFMANMQFYNASLDSNSVQALYAEGIGGVPIDLHNLVGWWPLNGNSNDYSGNGNNGQPTEINYTEGWISSYNPP